MVLLQLMVVGVLSAPASGPRIAPIGFNAPMRSAVGAGDTVPRRRPTAVEYSDAYYTRAKIHRVATYAEFPLFVAEYTLGQRLLKEERTGVPSDGLKTAHTTVALGLGALFTVNTVTGVWNLWDSRRDPAGRTRLLIHSAAMLGADAGFMLAGATGGGANEGGNDANRHRTIAISSMALATAGTVMMWLFPD
jgi:hypothetical protein